MQRRAACLEDGVPNRMMAAIRIYRSQTERVQTLPEPRTGGGCLRIFRDFFLIPDTPERGSHCPSVRFRFCMKSRGFPVRGFRISGIRLFIMSPAGDALSGAVTAFLPLIKRSGCGMLTGYCQSYSFSSIVRCRR